MPVTFNPIYVWGGGVDSFTASSQVLLYILPVLHSAELYVQPIRT
jgi:hypothetical protein